MLKTSQTCFFHVPDTSGKFTKNIFRVILTFKKVFFSKIFEIQIFQDFAYLTPKREATDLQVPQEIFLEILHPHVGM